MLLESRCVEVEGWCGGGRGGGASRFCSPGDEHQRELLGTDGPQKIGVCVWGCLFETDEAATTMKVSMVDGASRASGDSVETYNACCAAYIGCVSASLVTHRRHSIAVSIPACHAGDPGSIPGRGETFCAGAATFSPPGPFLSLISPFLAGLFSSVVLD